MIIEITQYRTSDGKLFTDRTEAERHERFAIFYEKLLSGILRQFAFDSDQVAEEVQALARELHANFNISPKIKP